jgi:hypothetical protein
VLWKWVNEVLGVQEKKTYGIAAAGCCMEEVAFGLRFGG